MRAVLIQGTVHCGVFRDFVFHLQADELAEADRARLHEHLDACIQCARYLEVEQAFIQTLQTRIPRSAPPDGLEDRVRCALAEHGCEALADEPGKRRTWWWGFAAAAVLLIALIPLVRSWSHPIGGASPRHVTIEATLVDEDCDRAGCSVSEQRNCTKKAHLNALKLADGSYWSLSVEDANARDLVADVELRGRRMTVEGDFYPGIRTLHLTRMPETGSSRRRSPDEVERLYALYP